MERRFFLDVVIRKSATVLKLFAGKNETLLVRRDPLFVLDLRLDVVDGVRRLNLKGDRLTREGLHKDLHTTTETKDYRDVNNNVTDLLKHTILTKMEGRLLLDVIVGKRATILELFTSEDQSLLVRGDALLVLDLSLDVIDCIGGLDLQGNRLTRKGLDEYLHAAAKTEDKVESRLLLNVIVG